MSRKIPKFHICAAKNEEFQEIEKNSEKLLKKHQKVIFFKPTKMLKEIQKVKKNWEKTSKKVLKNIRTFRIKIQKIHENSQKKFKCLGKFPKKFRMSRKIPHKCWKNEEFWEIEKKMHTNCY